MQSATTRENDEMNKPTFTHTHTRAHAHAHTHARTHTRLHTHTTCTYVHTYMHSMHTCIHTYNNILHYKHTFNHSYTYNIHTCTHIYIRTNTHTHRVKERATLSPLLSHRSFSEAGGAAKTPDPVVTEVDQQSVVQQSFRLQGGQELCVVAVRLNRQHRQTVRGEMATRMRVTRMR